MDARRHAFVAGLALAVSCTTSAAPVARSSAPQTSSIAVGPASVVPATPPASATCVPEVTPSSPLYEPSHAPVDGEPRLQEPVRSGVIVVQIEQCRTIDAVMARYGLTGRATRYMPDVTSPESATRWYLIEVPVGTEGQTVVELWRHRDDFAHVQLLPAFQGGPAGG